MKCGTGCTTDNTNKTQLKRKNPKCKDCLKTYNKKSRPKDKSRQLRYRAKAILELSEGGNSIHSSLLRENIYFCNDFIEEISKSYQRRSHSKKYRITPKGEPMLEKIKREIQQEIQELDDQFNIPRDTVKIKIQDVKDTQNNYQDPDYKYQDYCYWFTGTTAETGRHYNLITSSKKNRYISTFNYEYDIKGSNWAVFLSLAVDPSIYPNIKAYVSDTSRYRGMIAAATTLSIDEIKTEITAVGFGRNKLYVHFMLKDIDLFTELFLLAKEMTTKEKTATGELRDFIDHKIQNKEEQEKSKITQMVTSDILLKQKSKVTYKTRRWFMYEFYEDQMRRAMLDFAHTNTMGHYGQVHDCVYTEDEMDTVGIERYIKKMTNLDVGIKEMCL